MSTPTESKGRPLTLPGTTYKTRVQTRDGDLNVYITICELDGRPYELFLNCKDAALMEHMNAMSLLVSRMFQAGISPEDIASDLMSIHSPVTGHFVHGGYCPSLAARIGGTIRDHAAAVMAIKHAVGR